MWWFYSFVFRLNNLFGHYALPRDQKYVDGNSWSFLFPDLGNAMINNAEQALGCNGVWAARSVPEVGRKKAEAGVKVFCMNSIA